MSALSDVHAGDPHVEAHNTERHAINAIKNLSDADLQASLTAAFEARASSPELGISVSNAVGDAQAILDAITVQTSGGKVSGKLRTTQGKVARISSPTTINLGYTNTQAANWATDTTTEKFKFSLDILPDSGVGAALTIKGGYGVELDINVLGGGGRGTVTDAATTTRTTSADGIMLAGSTALASASGAFTGADQGALIIVPGAGASGASMYAKIASVTDSTHAVLDTAALTAVTTAAVTIGSFTVSSPNAIAAGLKPGAVVFITGAGPSPEGQTQPLAASVRSVNTGAGTFTLSESSHAAVTGATMNWFDVAIRLEDMVGARVNVYGKGFAGCLLAADATDDPTKRLRSCDVPSVINNSCGMGIFFKSIEAFGSFGHIVSNTVFGDYFGLGADLHWDHFEGGIAQPTSQLARAYLWFDRHAQCNNLGISVGDRATEAAVLMTSDTGGTLGIMGRFSQIRATMYAAQATGDITSGDNRVTNVVTASLTMKVGQRIFGPGIPDGTTITAVTGTGNGYTSGSPGTITMSAPATANSSSQTVYGLTADGLKLVGIPSITIGMVETARCVAGMRVRGGGLAGGIRVLSHRSLTTDAFPLVIEAGTTGTPTVEVNANYRYHLRYSADIGSGLGGADINLTGRVETMHQVGGATGKYAIRSASATALLNVAGLHQIARAGLSGLVDRATVALRGWTTARLDNEVPAAGTYEQNDGAGGKTLAVASGAGLKALVVAESTIPNTTTETPMIAYTIPAGSLVVGNVFRVKVWGWAQQGVNVGTLTFRLRYGGITGASIGSSISIAQTGAGTTRVFSFEYLVVVRAVGASGQMAVEGRYFAPGTSGALVQPIQAAYGTPPPAATTVGTTTTKDLAATAVWATADPTNIVYVEGGSIEQIA